MSDRKNSIYKRNDPFSLIKKKPTTTNPESNKQHTIDENGYIKPTYGNSNTIVDDSIDGGVF